jgi:nucleoside-diphosphate-sugar epimerase
MKVFVAGGSGTIGIPLVRALVASGHEVTALTRSADKQAGLRALGAFPAVADALDPDALVTAVEAARPTHIIHQLTALPKEGPRSAKELTATNRLRIEGTRHLLNAAICAGAKRFIVGSFALLAPRSLDEATTDDAARAIQSMERQVLEASERGSLEGVILRYGMFYGPEVPSTLKMIDMIRKRRLPVVRGDMSQLPLIHVDDAVSATLASLERAPAGRIYDIADDRAVSMSEIVRTIAEYSGSPAPFTVPSWLPRLIAPYMARITSMQMPLSNAKAKAELGWRLKYPTMREGLVKMYSRAA